MRERPRTRESCLRAQTAEEIEARAGVTYYFNFLNLVWQGENQGEASAVLATGAKYKRVQ